jgi:hypothetical protein
MPVEIRELIIKATVVQENTNSSGSASAPAGANNDVSPNEEMIRNCVEKILEILKRKNDR